MSCSHPERNRAKRGFVEGFAVACSSPHGTLILLPCIAGTLGSRKRTAPYAEAQPLQLDLTGVGATPRPGIRPRSVLELHHHSPPETPATEIVLPVVNAQPAVGTSPRRTASCMVVSSTCRRGGVWGLRVVTDRKRIAISGHLLCFRLRRIYFGRLEDLGRTLTRAVPLGIR